MQIKDSQVSCKICHYITGRYINAIFMHGKALGNISLSSLCMFMCVRDCGIGVGVGYIFLGFLLLQLGWRSWMRKCAVVRK